MKKRGILLSTAVLTALTAFKLLFPDLTAAVQESASQALGVEAGYMETLNAIGTRLSSAQSAPASRDAAAAPQPSPTPVPAQPKPLEYRMEEGSIRGEHATALPPAAAPEPPSTPEPEDRPSPTPEPAPHVLDAVAAFLESQADFLDSCALPENVDYDYTEFPFDYVVPVSGYQSSGFGYRMHPILNAVRFHYGTDIAANSGEDILAFSDGTVIFAGQSSGYGNYITIDHGDGWTSSYAHCSKLLVTNGQKVQAGEQIALVGATGQVTGPHLHFELRHNGIFLNPEYYING